jgi:4-hydroxybenzoate polyprenyltransferase
MLKYIFFSLRPKQWIKNAIIFIPLVFSGNLFSIEKLVTTGSIFLLFCLFCSATYILNDIHDRKADALHPEKRNRPIASGKI